MIRVDIRLMQTRDDKRGGEIRGEQKREERRMTLGYRIVFIHADDVNNRLQWKLRNKELVKVPHPEVFRQPLAEVQVHIHTEVFNVVPVRRIVSVMKEEEKSREETRGAEWSGVEW